jgi:hypothetical protein
MIYMCLGKGLTGKTKVTPRGSAEGAKCKHNEGNQGVTPYQAGQAGRTVVLGGGPLPSGFG